ncbi:MAG: hypothetical protein RL710_1135 [Pseudomonadota bacterium]
MAHNLTQTPAMQAPSPTVVMTARAQTLQAKSNAAMRLNPQPMKRYFGGLYVKRVIRTPRYR